MQKTSKKDEKIKELENRLFLAAAGHTSNLFLAYTAIDKVSADKLMGSGVILQLKSLSGEEIFEPVLIHDGLSPSTINALKSDFKRSQDIKDILRIRPEKETNE